MERDWIPPDGQDWIPPEPAGVEQVGSDEDLKERTVERPEFLGEFGEREEPHREDEEPPH